MVLFRLVERSFQDYVTDLIGISKDTYVQLGAPTFNYGLSPNMLITEDGSGIETVGILEIQMPTQDDIPGSDDIWKVELGLWIVYAGTATPAAIAIYELPDSDVPWEEGTGGVSGSVGYCNWQQRDVSLDWSKYAEHSKVYSDEDVGLISESCGPNSSWKYFDLTSALSWGVKKTFIIRNLSVMANKLIQFASKDKTNPSLRPILKVTYRDYPPDAFSDKDTALSIKPNPDNPVQPLLKWGGVDDVDFVDFKVYRNTIPITSVAALSPIATITSPADQEYIDTSIIAPSIEGVLENTTYYYMVIAEDSSNVLDTAKKSSNVSFKRPNDAFVFIQNVSTVGSTAIVRATSTIPCKKVYVDWGDGAGGYWIESETEVTVFTLSHTYSSTGAKTISARVESTLGFWSDLDTITTNVIADVAPRAIMTARPLEVVVGEIVRLNAALSHPIANNEILTYQFYKDGSIISAWSSNPIASYTALVGDIATSPIDFTCKVRNSLLLESALSSIESVSVISNKPATLAFSRDTVITSRNEGRQTGVDSAMVQGGSQEEDVRYGLSNVVITIDGISSRFNMPTDLEIIKDAVEDYDYVQLKVRDELCGAYVYYAGRMVSYRINKTTKRSVSWSVEFRVNARSLTDLSL